MERTEAGGRLKSIRGIWQNQPPMGFSRKLNFLEEENKDFYTHNFVWFNKSIYFEGKYIQSFESHFCYFLLCAYICVLQ